MRDELDPREPKLPQMLNYEKIVAKVEMSKATMLLQMRWRKDWANSAVHKNHVMDQDFEDHNMETIESAVTATNRTSKDTTILNANETEYLSKLFCQ